MFKNKVIYYLFITFIFRQILWTKSSTTEFAKKVNYEKKIASHLVNHLNLKMHIQTIHTSKRSA